MKPSPGDHVIVLPGGGYSEHAAHEAEPIREWLRGLGIASSVFRYPVRSRHPEPLLAIRHEVAKVRTEGASRVGLIGFSAGGHAAALAALAPGATQNERIDLVVLGYPVISMLSSTHQGSRDNLIGSDANRQQRADTSPELMVAADSPPFFIFHTAEDPAVPVQHSLLLANALAEEGVSFELHIYERGRHGVGFGTDLGTVQGWRTACENWLAQSGWPQGD